MIFQAGLGMASRWHQLAPSVPSGHRQRPAEAEQAVLFPSEVLWVAPCKKDNIVTLVCA